MWRFGAVSILSAFLLFGVELLMGKYALPLFGGTPAVWTACLVFFQLGLLAGYAYAHALLVSLPVRRQAQVHGALLVAALGMLIGRAVAFGAPLTPAPAAPWSESELVVQVLRMLTVTVGPAFLALSATAPLVQGWFRVSHPDRSPYRLYALSNAGSVVALIAYPSLIEPFVTRAAQAWIFGIGFLIFTALCALCVRRAMAAPALAPEPKQSVSGAHQPLRWAIWIFLAGVGSLFLCATTSQISQDVAAGPFLWMVPLALYLTSFILCFEHERLYARIPMAVLFALLLGVVAYQERQGATADVFTRVAAGGGLLFAGCMILHGELYRLRPEAARLSTFYLCVSIGGALGGMFAGLVAPRMFRGLSEYPWSIGLASAVMLVALVMEPREKKWGKVASVVTSLGAAIFGLGVWLYIGHRAADPEGLLYMARNTFGVVRVLESKERDPDKHQFLLLHGAVRHGAQFTDATLRRRPSTYYTEDSGLGQAIAQERLAHPGRGLRIGILGLGVGTAAALGQPGDTIRFYEINPLVTELAKGEGGYFHYLGDTQAKVEVVEGDARQVLERELQTTGSQKFDVLAVDAFSGDAIPIHLLTEQAFGVYMKHVGEGGLLALHVSNMHLDLAGVVDALAQKMNLSAVDVAVITDDARTYPSQWMVLAPPGRKLDPTTFARSTVNIVPPKPTVAWTDEYSALLPALWAKRNQ